jgi:predicted nucleic acid-binding Zn ribbon protein
MMRRRGPRPIASALEGLVREAAPATLLARVQSAWTDAVGAAIAAEAQPVAEREGTLTVACRSATWASEIELLAPDLLEKLNRAIGGGAEGQLTRLRAQVRRAP